MGSDRVKRRSWLPASTTIERAVLMVIIIVAVAILCLGAAWVGYVATFGRYPDQGELATWLLRLKA